MLKIYHNPRCSKSRAGLKYLRENNIEHEVFEYLKQPVDAITLKTLIDKTGKKPIEVVRTQEKEYKENLKGKDISDKELLEFMARHPKLLKRPIVESEDKAVIAQPPEEIEKIRN